ncbi:hypothetical protein E6P70_03120 [Moraxella nonliquefaciens]|nr:hypothetical protein [Moraxella nonliquefaciens]MDI4497618.1 hypothetical protein [Moraxella nonliquefaciens]MDI4499609.1 hypothetical protein [Moraxella nonliquefaciens]
MKKYYDPIILDLDGNGVGRVSKFGVLFVMNGGAMFDHDGDGIAIVTSWVSGADGLLVLDRNGDGVIMGHHNLNIPAINEVQSMKKDGQLDCYKGTIRKIENKCCVFVFVSEWMYNRSAVMVGREV